MNDEYSKDPDFSIQAKKSIATGKAWPYDAPENWRYKNATESEPHAQDSAHTAARGILSYIRDELNIKSPLDYLSIKRKQVVIFTIIEIIKESEKKRLSVFQKKKAAYFIQKKIKQLQNFDFLEK